MDHELDRRELAVASDCIGAVLHLLHFNHEDVRRVQRAYVVAAEREHHTAGLNAIARTLAAIQDRD